MSACKEKLDILINIHRRIVNGMIKHELIVYIVQVSFVDFIYR
jgi:hypothetical protein